jgi:hypothetical protein
MLLLGSVCVQAKQVAPFGRRLLLGLGKSLRAVMGVIHQVATASTAFAFFLVLLFTSQTFVASKARPDMVHLTTVIVPL